MSVRSTSAPKRYVELSGFYFKVHSSRSGMTIFLGLDSGAYINGIGPRVGEKKRSNYLACNSHEENTIGHGQIPAS